jgi:hypothetical protein
MAAANFFFACWRARPGGAARRHHTDPHEPSDGGRGRAKLQCETIFDNADLR